MTNSMDGCDPRRNGIPYRDSLSPMNLSCIGWAGGRETSLAGHGR